MDPGVTDSILFIYALIPLSEGMSIENTNTELPYIKYF